jgi:pimeloyl-ACP methyl ester carboxylesterase
MATILPSRARPAMPWAGRRAGDDYGAHDEPDWRTIDWSEHLHDTLVGGRRMRYVDLGGGDGPPIVFVHGLAGNWQNWLENLPRLARERRVLAPDLPGFGHSESPPEGISISGYGRAVNEFCDRLELDEVVLVGNSLGGFTSAETAIQFPARVERLVLVSAVGITTSDLQRAPAMVWGRVVAMAGARGAAERRMAIVRPRLRHAVFAAIMRHPSRIATEMLWEMSEGAGRDAFLPALVAMLDYDYRDRLGDVTAPTLVIAGEDDMLVPVKDASEYERLIPRARKLVFEDTGHVAMVERPRTFNQALIEFIREPVEGAAVVGGGADGAEAAGSDDGGTQAPGSDDGNADALDEPTREAPGGEPVRT